jgi:hypothetical protein
MMSEVSRKSHRETEIEDGFVVAQGLTGMGYWRAGNNPLRFPKLLEALTRASFGTASRLLIPLGAVAGAN